MDAMQRTVTKRFRCRTTGAVTAPELMLEALYELTNKGKDPFPLEKLVEFYYRSGLVADYNMTRTADGRIFSSGVAEDFDTLRKAGFVYLDEADRINITCLGEKKINEEIITLPIAFREKIAIGRLATTHTAVYSVNGGLKNILHIDSLV